MPCSPIIHRNTQSVLVPVAKAEALWPDAKTITYRGQLYAIMAHDPRTQIQLRAAGIEIPAPILYHYDWASADGEKPFQVQKDTCAGMTSHQRFYCLNDMGTGKTKATLWAWRYLYKIGMAKKLLVVAPLSTLKFVWAREIMQTMPEIRCAVLHGVKSKRLELLNSDSDFYIINHDGLKTIVTELHQREDIDTLVLDELAVYRNNSQRSKRMRIFAHRFTWVWGLTGRPMPTSPVDVWNQCMIVTPGRNALPKFYSHAKTALLQQVDLYKWVPREGAIETAYRWMQPSVRFSLDDVVELPEAISRTLDVELSEEQATKYRELANQFVIWVEEKRITAANAAVALGKLLQVGSGYVYYENPKYATLDSEPRQQLLLDLLEESPHKTIVFGPWRHVIDNLSALLTKEEITHAVIHGGTSLRKRGDIFNMFQNEENPRVLLAHPGCIHHGVTLTAATTSIWYGPVTSLDIYEQANARIRRVGQKHKQLFLHIQATAVERKVYGMLRSKQRMQDRFLELIKTAAPGASDDKSERKTEQQTVGQADRLLHSSA